MRLPGEVVAVVGRACATLAVCALALSYCIAQRSREEYRIVIGADGRSSYVTSGPIAPGKAAALFAHYPPMHSPVPVAAPAPAAGAMSAQPRGDASARPVAWARGDNSSSTRAVAEGGAERARAAEKSIAEGTRAEWRRPREADRGARAVPAVTAVPSGGAAREQRGVRGANARVLRGATAGRLADRGEGAWPAADLPPPLDPPSPTYAAHLAYEAKAVARRAIDDDEQRKIQRQSGWALEDSHVGLRASGADAAALAPLLTGNAWHWGARGCPAACAANGGVCLPDLGRCDCPRHRWGPECETLVQPAVARPQLFHGWCVYNDSSPWFCDKPLCARAGRRTHQQQLLRVSARDRPVSAPCVGEPPSSCPHSCSDRGACVDGKCKCYPGYRGRACQQAETFHCIRGCLGRGECDAGFCRCRPPYYGVDCSLSPPPARVARARGRACTCTSSHRG